MISVKNIQKFYGDFEALKGVSFEVNTGEIVGLLGPNGAGKTTTLKILAGSLDANKGAMLVDGFDAAKDMLAIKSRLGYLPETNPLYDDLRVVEFLNYVAELKGVEKNKIKERVREIIKKTGLQEKAGQLISQLSKGYRQRVGLAQALMNDPSVLILDEPTEGLDPNQRIEIRSLIRELGKQRTVVFSSHILSEVEAICDRVLIINQGLIVASGTPAELKAQTRKATRLEILLKAPEDLIRQHLGTFTGVERIIELTHQGDFRKVVLEIDSTMEIRPQLIRFIMDKGWELFGLNQEERSLEDVFVALTK